MALTLEEIRSMVEEYCTLIDEDCDNCAIYNLYGRSGSCYVRLYLDQQQFKVHELLDQIQNYLADHN